MFVPGVGRIDVDKGALASMVAAAACAFVFAGCGRSNLDDLLDLDAQGGDDDAAATDAPGGSSGGVSGSSGVVGSSSSGIVGTSSGVSPGGIALTCTDSSACDPGQVCCATVSFANGISATSACFTGGCPSGGMTFQLCSSSAECPNGTSCGPNPLGMGPDVCGSSPGAEPDASMVTAPPSGTCATPDDCTALLGPLPKICSDSCTNGADGCEHYVCISGVCETTFCTSQPDDAGECQTEQDCLNLLGPLPKLCIVGCTNGSSGCEHYLCLAGICQTTYCD